MALRVDEIPWPLTPAFHLYGLGGGLAFQLLCETTRRTCTFEGLPQDRRDEPARIECIWHEHLPVYLASYLPGPRPHVWLNHPVWYMRPVHVLLRMRGVEHICLGSSGHGGRDAAQKVVRYLRAGYSTGVAVDGPGGPARVLKAGALHMAAASGLPVVAIRFEYERALRGSGWDRKQFPLPGSRIRVFESAPIVVARDAPEKSRDALERALG